MSTCGVGGWGGPLPGDPGNNSILSATPAFGGIDVAWTYPTTNPFAVAYTKIYRALVGDFAAAILVKEDAGTFWYDKKETATRYYYWIRLVSINGTVGDLIGPASAVAKPTIEAMIELLTGVIDNGFLATSLKTQIARIQVLALDLAGEVVSRENGEVTLSQAMAAVDAGVAQALTFLASEQTSRVSADSVLAESLNLVAVTWNGNLAAVQTTLRAEIAVVDGRVTTTANQITQVAAQAAQDLALVNSNLHAEIVTVDGRVSVVSSRVDTVQASIAGAGANRLRNSGFESVSRTNVLRAAGWDGYNQSSGSEPSTLSLVTGRIGGLAQRLTWTGANTSTKGVLASHAIDGTGLGGVIGGWKPNTTYVVSWYARSNTDTAAALGMVMEWNIRPSTTTVLANPALSSGTWNRYALKLVMGASVEAIGRLYISVSYAAGQTGYIEVDDVQVQEGDLLTGYAPGDQAELFAAVQTEQLARIDQDAVLASAITTAESAAAGNLAQAQTTLQTNINTVNGKVTQIGALYTAKLSVNGLVGGFGVYNDGSTVQAGFDVDEFWIGRTQANKRKPFIIDGGVVYVDEAAINKLTFSKLRDEAGSFIVENGKVKADFISIKGLSVTDAAGNVVVAAGTGLDFASRFALGTTGVPANNATVGATWGNNIVGQPTTLAGLDPTAAALLADKLSRSGADTMSGPISLVAANAILVGTVNDGLYLGSTGLVGRKASMTTFSVDAAGNATFGGDLNAATGTFAGQLTAAALRIAGSNLFSPSYASSGSQIYCTSVFVDAGLTAASINPGTSGSVSIVVTCDFICGSSNSGGETDTLAYTVPTFQLLRNGIPVASWSPPLGAVPTSRANNTYTLLDTPGGAVVYKVQVQDVLGSGSSKARLLTRTMTVMGVTR